MRLRYFIFVSLLVAGLLGAHSVLADTDAMPADAGRATIGAAASANPVVGPTPAAELTPVADSTPAAEPNPSVEPASVADALPLKDEIPKESMPEIKVTVSPEKGAIGDLIEWKVAVKKKHSLDRVVLPSSLDFGKLEIQNRKVSNETSDEKSMTQELGVGLISLETGTFEIPPQKLTVVDDKGNLSEVMTPSFSVTIDSLIANEPEPAIKADEKDGEVVMVEDYTLLYVAIGLAAALVVVLLTLLVRKLLSLRKPKPGPPPPPPRPAHEVALEKLNALRIAGYLDEQMHKLFHLKLSEAFREYLGNRYDFDALERSTREIVDELRRLSLGVELRREIVQLLEDTDLVKFAKYEPARAESESLLEEAFRIVEVTTSPIASTTANRSIDTQRKNESGEGGTR